MKQHLRRRLAMPEPGPQAVVILPLAIGLPIAAAELMLPAAEFPAERFEACLPSAERADPLEEASLVVLPRMIMDRDGTSLGGWRTRSAGRLRTRQNVAP